MLAAGHDRATSADTRRAAVVHAAIQLVTPRTDA
jgi:hypothetical protein